MRFFLTYRKASIDAGLVLLVVWLLEVSWRATGLLHGKMDTGMDWLCSEAFFDWLKRLWWRGVLICVLIWEPDVGWAAPPHFKSR